MSSLQSLGKSIGAKLSRIAREKLIPYERVLTNFLIERLVARITEDKELCSHMIFKGGYVSLRVFESPRFTYDLDAVIQGSTASSIIEKLKMIIPSSEIMDGAWFRYESIRELPLQNEYGGTRIGFRAGLGEPLEDLKRAQIVNFDVGVGDPVFPTPGNSQLNFLLGKEALTWRVYSCESIVSEKIHALLDRGSESSRSKDIFDLDFLIGKCDSVNLREALRHTFEFRKKELPANLSELLRSIDRSTLRLGWKSATADVSSDIFDVIFDRLLLSLDRKL